MAFFGKVLGLVVLLSVATLARGADEYPFCIDFTQGSSLVYQLPRAVIAAQPKWAMGDPLPVPLTKLCQTALDGSKDPKSPAPGGWRVEHVQFWRFKGPQHLGANPRFQATADVPEDLQDRWFCVVEMSHFGDRTGEWWRNIKYAVVLLDGTYVPLSKVQS